MAFIVVGISEGAAIAVVAMSHASAKIDTDLNRE
jgi:hypothetical protein